MKTYPVYILVLYKIFSINEIIIILIISCGKFNGLKFV